MTLKQLVNPRKSALLIVDIQYDYCSKEGKLAKHWKNKNNLYGDTSPIEDMLLRLENFIKICRKNKIPIIWLRMSEDSKLMPKNYLIRETFLGKNFLDLCVKNTKGFEFYKLKPEKNDYFDIVKIQYNAFTNLKLNKLLNKLNISTTIITGVLTSRCVKATVQGAVEQGYNVVVPEDLVAMFKEHKHHHETALDDINRIFGYVINSKNIIKTWKSN